MRAVTIAAHVACVLAALLGNARGAPRPDLVVIWTPGLDRAPIVAIADNAGIAALDRTPAPPPPHSAGPVLAQAIDAFDRLRLDDAWAALEQARAIVDETGGGGLSPSGLGDLFLYRALVRDQRGDAPGAWDEWLIAVSVAPERALDAARFPPRVIAEHERARAVVVARPRGSLTVTDAVGCALLIDGAPATTPAALPVGAHWLRVACAGAAPWGTRVTITEGATHTIAARPVEPPSDDELLVLARSSGATSFVTVVVRGEVAWVRLVGADGRERGQRTVATSAGSTAVAAALGALVQAPTRTPWYRSRWAWAAGAAGLTAAIVIPLAIALSGEGAPTSATVVGPGSRL